MHLIEGSLYLHIFDWIESQILQGRIEREKEVAPTLAELDLLRMAVFVRERIALGLV